MHNTQLAFSRLLPAIGGIYISQTILTALVTQALPTLLRAEGASLQLIGLTSLLWLPWALKFLWAPLVESWRLPAHKKERHSRRILLTSQGLLALVLMLLGLAGFYGLLALNTHAGLILTVLIVGAFLSAGGDVACDGFAIDQLAVHQRGWGNVAQVGGSYLGGMLGGGGFLLVAALLDWPLALLVASLTLLVLSLPLLRVHEPPRSDVIAPHRPSLMYALKRKEVLQGLLLVVLASVGLRMVFGMLGPLLMDRQVSMEQIGWIFGSFSLLAGLLGSFLGGLLVRRTLAWRAVWITLGLECLVLAALALAAAQAPVQLLIPLVGLLFLMLGCVWVTLYSALMGLASPHQAGVDFTLFQSADAGIAILGGMAGGWLAHHWGYQASFGLAALLTLLAALVIHRYAQHQLLNTANDH